jgi:cytochrome b6-f complex iron-sulfur subunit
LTKTDDVRPTTGTRREFCVRACQAVSLAALTPMVQGCAGPAGPDLLPNIPTINASLVGSSITLSIDASSPIAGVGNAALVQTSGGSLLVAHTAQNSFIALSSVCTHQVCTVSEYQNQVYECPCHGSQYSTSGAVVRGPATAPLRQFATSFTNNVLTISTV